MSKTAQPEEAETPSSNQERVKAELDIIGQSVAAVYEFYLREERKLTRAQRLVEVVSGFVGRPVFLAIILLFVLSWVSINLLVHELGWSEFDPPPFGWLQGVLGLSGLLTATVVLSKQNRVSRLAEQRAHLDLKMALLTEQRTAKLIDLLEELRRDLPDVRNRDDSHAAALTEAMSPDKVLAALDEHTSAAAAPESAEAPAPATPPPAR